MKFGQTPAGVNSHASLRETRYHARQFLRINNMKAEKDKVVSFYYQLTEECGGEMENSNGREPMTFLFGHGNIIPGLEQAMVDHVVGDKFDAVVAAKDA